jgi:glycosyltransferase involved in cell wall biosynthesis
MDAIVANSRLVAERMSRMFDGSLEGDVEVITAVRKTDGIPVRTIPFLTSSDPAPAPLNRPPVKTLRVAFLGRLAPHKRPDLLIEAWPVWNTRPPIAPARLDIYGGDYDNEADRLQARITELGLQDSIHIHGTYTTRDLPKIFAVTDLVVLPSRYEGLPLVLVEAMQRGIPVVATSAGGTAELGDDNPDVLITDGTDWDQFAPGLETMASRIRAGEIDRARLQEWTESRYGFAPVADLWRQALLTPDLFFTNQATSRAPCSQLS